MAPAASCQRRGLLQQHAGLINLGNTCYLNAVLQVLLRCPGLTDLLRAQQAQAASTDSLLGDLCCTFEHMATQRASHSPSRLLERLRRQHPVFRSGGQHDAQELLRCLLLSVHEVAPAPAEGTAPAADGAAPAAEAVFRGQIDYCTRCLECDGRRTRREAFCDLSLPVHHAQSLEWGLEQFFGAEALRGADKYFCQTCRANTEAVRTPRLAHAPPVLSLHLKRFACDGGEAEARRVAQHVALPASLSLRPYATPGCEQRPRTYVLFALVAHSGRSGCGHYTAFVRPSAAASSLDAALGDALPSGDEWLCFDDEECSAISAAELAAAFAPDSRSAALACMCFYRVVDQDSIG